MSWSQSRGDSRLTALGLPASIKGMLMRQKARTRKTICRQVCEALIRDWQQQELLAASPPLCEDWPQVSVPPQTQSPVPGSPVVPHPNPPQQHPGPPQRLAPGTALHNGAVYRVQQPKVLPVAPEGFE